MLYFFLETTNDAILERNLGDGAFRSADNLSSDTLRTHRSMLSPLSVLSRFIFTPVLRGGGALVDLRL